MQIVMVVWGFGRRYGKDYILKLSREKMVQVSLVA